MSAFRTFITVIFVVGSLGTLSTGIVFYSLTDPSVDVLDRKFMYIGGSLVLFSIFFFYFCVRYIFNVELQNAGVSSKIHEIAEANANNNTRESWVVYGAIVYRIKNLIPFYMALIYGLTAVGILVVINGSPYNLFIGLGLIGVVALSAVVWLIDNQYADFKVLSVLKTHYADAFKA